MSKVILGRVARKTLPNRTVQSPTQAGSPSALTDIVTYSYQEGSGPTTTHDWKIPSAASAGDLVIGFISVHDGSGSASGVATVPSGWTLQDDGNDGNADSAVNAYYYIYTRILDGTENYTGDTFTTDTDSNVVATWWGVKTGGSTPTITLSARNDSVSPNPPAVSAPSAGDYWCFTLCGFNKGIPDPDPATGGPAGYDLLSWLDTVAGVGLGAKHYLHSSFKTLTTQEDPASFSWNQTSGTRYYAQWTMLVTGGGADPTVAPFDHDHVEADITDLAHTTDHGALTGLADDDHTQYSKADGSRAFTGEVAGVTPTVDASLATKAYVDSNSSAYYEVVVSGSAPPVAVTNEAEDDWVYGEVT